MNLAQLRGRILNQLDYTPVPNQQLGRYLDGVINDAYMEIWMDRPYLFNIKEKDFRVFPDFTGTDLAFVGTYNAATFTFASDVVTFAASFYESADPNIDEKFIGAAIKDKNGVSYIITNIISATSMKLDRAYEGDTYTSTTTTDYTVYHRYAYLPQDLVEIEDISFPNYPINVNRKGKTFAVPRRIEVDLDMNQDISGQKPNYYVPLAETHAPEIPNGITTVAGGAGSSLPDDTYYFASTFIDHTGAESGFTDLQGVTTSSNDNITISPDTALISADPARRFRLKVYYGHKQANQDNYVFYHIGTIYDRGSSTVTFDNTLLTSVKRGNYFDKRFVSSTGCKAVRFHPRPTVVDKTITVGDASYTTSQQTFWHLRYLYRPYDLVDDYDVPKIPEHFHNLIVDRALVDVHQKFGNSTAADVAERRFMKRKRAMDARYASERDTVIQRGQSMAVSYDKFNVMYPNRTLVYKG
jgi:hypothetical protein